MLLAKSRWWLAGWIGQLIVTPHQLEGRANAQLHVAGGEPFAAQIALREIGPDALDGPGQETLYLQCGGLDQHAMSVWSCAFVH
jgi:hypothetical protein